MKQKQRALRLEHIRQDSDQFELHARLATKGVCLVAQDMTIRYYEND